MKSLQRLIFAWFVFLSFASILQAKCPFPNESRVLFIGDSITDMNRERTDDPNHILGHSYVFLVAAKIGASYPEATITFINRGISGDGVSDLANRWKEDVIDHNPDILSILIGVNDVLLDHWGQSQLDIDTFSATYQQLLTDARMANPQLEIVLCCPFILPGKHTQEQWDVWQHQLGAIHAVVKSLSDEFAARLVDFQPTFDAAAAKPVPADYWIWDGVHPTYRGHQLMADEWLRSFNPQVTASK